MNKRTFIALLLTALVIVVTPMLFPSPPKPRPIAGPASADTSARGATSQVAGATTAVAPVPAASSAPANAAPTVAAVRAETTTVSDEGVRYSFTSAGAAPLAVTMSDSLYRTLRRDQPRSAVSIVAPRGPLLRYRVAFGRDTIALDTIPFTAQRGGN